MFYEAHNSQLSNSEYINNSMGQPSTPSDQHTDQDKVSSVFNHALSHTISQMGSPPYSPIEKSALARREKFFTSLPAFRKLTAVVKTGSSDNVIAYLETARRGEELMCHFVKITPAPIFQNVLERAPDLLRPWLTGTVEGLYTLFHKISAEKRLYFLTPNIDGVLPLHRAIENKQHDVAKMFLALAGVSERRQLFSQDQFGCTPLHYAVETYAVETIRLLFKSSTPEEQHLLNAIDDEGMTPFALALETESLLIVKSFLDLAAPNEAKEMRDTLALSQISLRLKFLPLLMPTQILPSLLEGIPLRDSVCNKEIDWYSTPTRLIDALHAAYEIVALKIPALMNEEVVQVFHKKVSTLLKNITPSDLALAIFDRKEMIAELLPYAPKLSAIVLTSLQSGHSLAQIE